MHAMILRICRLDRQKGAGADMQRHGVECCALRFDRRDELGGEMQARGRRGDSACVAGEERLIVLPVLRIGRPLAGDIGWQWHLRRDARSLVERGAGEREGKRDLALLALVFHFRVEAPAGRRALGIAPKRIVRRL